LRTITQVAEYFRRTEPQSPISDSLDEVVRRARMGFAELLQELLGEDASWRTALNNAGIRPKESDE
jgi:type VI secretion system protein ImpA